MLIDLARLSTSKPAVPLQRLWHDAGRLTPSLGCAKCPDRRVCGGLSVAAPIFDCMHLCCGNPGECDSVCRSKPEDFACRVREIGGFGLDNVPRAPTLAPPELPEIIPTVFHGDKRQSRFDGPGAVCIPLFKVIDVRGAEAKFLAARTEFTHIAFEFGTGAGWKGRIDWYAEQLTRLRAAVARPIQLIVRGGIAILPRLASTFDGVTLLETSTFVKTVRRKAAFLDRSSRLRWRHAPTQPNEMLDTLFEHNWTVVSEGLTKSRIVARKAA